MSWQKKYVDYEHIHLELDDVPTKERPRFSPKNGAIYTPRKTKNYERVIQDEWARQVGPKHAKHTGPVSVSIKVSRPLPKSAPKKDVGKSDLLKPDADNLAKVVCDSLNALAYVDDKQIISLQVEFLPRTSFGNPVLLDVYVLYYQEDYL